MSQKTRAVDVAEYILAQQGEMSAMKLHRLVYYCQAWHLAWSGRPLFDDEIQAWANGPVVVSLYELHKGDFTVQPGYFNAKLAALAAKDEPVRKDAPVKEPKRALRALIAVTGLVAASIIVRTITKGR